MSVFDGLEDFPPDPIFGLAIEFASDGREGKYTFVTGYYEKEDLKVPVFESVHAVEKRLGVERPSRTYLPPGGMRSFVEAIQGLVFGEEEKERITGVQTIGGTGALYLAGRIASKWTSEIAISNPTWANHWAIFPSAGLKTVPYPYYAKGKLLFAEMLAALPENAAVLLHTSCHNPSGLDLSRGEWEELIALCKKKNLFPILDMAYHGFAGTPSEDTSTARLFLESGLEFALTYTCSKSFGLYGERVGALFFVAEDPKKGPLIADNLRQVIRPSYSNPPTHGVRVVKEILTDPALKAGWEEELSSMRKRIKEMREAFFTILTGKDPDTDWGVIKRGKGLFYASELPNPALEEMRQEHALYLGPLGRINLTGINGKNIEQLADVLIMMRKKHS